MKEFVDECRSEWSRLGVPDEVAGEMAADLAADLREAEGEGISVEEMLGSSASDPRAFAAAWAAERGVVGQSLPRGKRRPRESLLAAVIGSVALVLAIVGGVLLIVDAPHDRRVALPPSDTLPTAAVWVARPGARAPAPAPARLVFSMDGSGRVIAVGVPPADARGNALGAGDSGLSRRELGSALLIAGLVGVVLSTLFLLWLEPGRRRAASA